uniref:ADP-ribosylation factor n=1 Tax=Solanum tuberosum TaxID=4113 RepID=M1BEC8_SOLTU
MGKTRVSSVQLLASTSKPSRMRSMVSLFLFLRLHVAVLSCFNNVFVLVYCCYYSVN